MPVIRPSTFYEWLMLLNKHRLKAGPLESFKESRTQHALGRLDRQSYGFWDHQTCSGYLNTDGPMPLEIKPAPPVKDGDKEWE